MSAASAISEWVALAGGFCTIVGERSKLQPEASLAAWPPALRVQNPLQACGTVVGAGLFDANPVLGIAATTATDLRRTRNGKPLIQTSPRSAMPQRPNEDGVSSLTALVPLRRLMASEN